LRDVADVVIEKLFARLDTTQTACAETALFLLRMEMRARGWETGGAFFPVFLFHWRNTQLHGTLGIPFLLLVPRMVEKKPGRYYRDGMAVLNVQEVVSLSGGRHEE